MLIGWHFLYEGLAKLANPNWSSVGYLLDSQGFLKGFYYSLANNSTLIQIIDQLKKQGKSVFLELFGDGILKAELQKYIKNT